MRCQRHQGGAASGGWYPGRCWAAEVWASSHADCRNEPSSRRTSDGGTCSRNQLAHLCAVEDVAARLFGSTGQSNASKCAPDNQFICRAPEFRKGHPHLRTQRHDMQVFVAIWLILLVATPPHDGSAVKARIPTLSYAPALRMTAAKLR